MCIRDRSNAVKFTEEGGVSLITEYDNGVLTLVVEPAGGRLQPDPRRAGGREELHRQRALREYGGCRFVIELPKQKDVII